MKIIFCSCIYNNLKEEFSKTNNAKPISGHLFQLNVIDGLSKNKIDLSVVNVPRISYFPKSKRIIVNKSKLQINDRQLGYNIGFFNILGINYYTQIMSMEKTLESIILGYPGEKIVLVTFNSYYPHSKAILKCKKKFSNVYTCDIIGDLHGKNGIKSPYKGLIGILVRRIENSQDILATSFDSYVLLTEKMANEVPVNNKPYCVVEGIYNDELIKNDVVQVHDYDCRYIFYAGSLSIAYGIEHLLKAFQLIEDKNLHLLIAGNGDGVALIRNYSRNDNRIKYLGAIRPEEVKQIQKGALALISPRQTNMEYVKYSFPSKTMECLASGVPYIAHRLPCEPPEYEDYICYPLNESDEALAKEISRIISLNNEERKMIGKKARKFIVENKNSKVMTKRIVDMLEAL